MNSIKNIGANKGVVTDSYYSIKNGNGKFLFGEVGVNEKWVSQSKEYNHYTLGEVYQTVSKLQSLLGKDCPELLVANIYYTNKGTRKRITYKKIAKAL